MDHILLCTNHIPLTTSIHNSFIEDYMLEANGSYVKVYLYLAKCIQYGESDLSISSLADRMDNTEKDILRALHYWEKKKLLKINRDTKNGDIIGIDMLAPPLQKSTAPDTNTIPEGQYDTALKADSMPEGQYDAAPKADSMPEGRYDAPKADNTQDMNSRIEKPISNVVPMPVKTAESSPEIAKPEVAVSVDQRKLLAQNEEFIWLCNVIESYLDRTLNSNEAELISYLYGTLHFSKDLLLHLYDYCISLGKTNYKYIQKVALSWDEQGIHTPEEAEQASSNYNTAYTSVARSLALDRALAPVEKKRVDHWQKEWGMDLSVILEACNRTILKLHKVDFHYIDGILDHWHQAGVHTLQDVERADQAYMQRKAEKNDTTPGQKPPKNKNQFQQFQQRETSSQEVDELERKLLFQ